MDKETLQKKIESGDTVWGYDDYVYNVPLRETKDRILAIVGNKLIADWRVEKGGCWYTASYKLEDLFATKEEAEWQLEFGNITRTEKLELPTWEQFKKNKCFNFVGIDWTFYELHNRRRNKLQLDYSYDNDYYRPEKEWKLTYENYLEACRLCKKLFLGEEL